MPSPSEALPVAARHDVYPAVSPDPHFADQTFKGKVVFETDASRGIGQEIATTYAKAGASVITARRQKTLDDVRATILGLVPHADILTIPVDVTQIKHVEAAVVITIEKFGKLDICAANAGDSRLLDKLLREQDPEEWWRIMEVNIRGVYNTAHQGHFFAMASTAGQMRLPRMSAYGLSKHAVIRLIEFIALEYPSLKTFAFPPGLIQTELFIKNPHYAPPEYDSVQLPAATLLYLSAGKADWLSGRYVDAAWDLEEVERDWKDKILESQALVNRLTIPL
ncbi:hypothetical protein EWM64_g8052 [Hericium alpestre]|uniref:NAD(P)-binding protein n=1 Tax=Hericium alpestre TaxID=135208 RepID=A0A4Y9ZMF1_9AGAM|nr:hypothetical protein EWM64_g8052 [Hericium alpestre]